MDRTEKLRAFFRVRSHQNENVLIEKMSLLKDLSENTLKVPKTTHSSNNHRNNLGAPDKGSFFTTPLTSRRKSTNLNSILMLAGAVSLGNISPRKKASSIHLYYIFYFVFFCAVGYS
jgi:hypothetical protein